MNKNRIDIYDWWLTVGTYDMYAYTKDVFTNEEIDAINKSSKSDSYLGNVDDKKQQLDYRNSTISNLLSSNEENTWLFEKITRG